MPQDLNMSVFSPVTGNVEPLSRVPDAVFAEKMLGDGLAVNPKDNFVYAPVDGMVKTLHKAFHALVIEAQGVEVLIHIGVETVNLKGEGFKAFVSIGQEVKKGDKLIEFDRDLIAAKTPSNLVIVIIANKPEIELKKTAAANIEHGQFLFSLGEGEADNTAQVKEDSPKGEASKSKVILVRNKNGFHARPAARIAKLAASFEGADIFILKGSAKANAKSMVEILGLSIDYKDEISIEAYGTDKELALEEVTSAILKGLDESVGSFAQERQKPKPDFTKEAQLNGVTVFPGLVIGKAFVLNKKEITVEENAQDKNAESSKLDAAVLKVKEALTAEMGESSLKDKKEILKAHLSILEDPFLLEIAKEYINNNKTAGFAWQAAIKKSIEVLNSTGNKLLQERVSDYKDAQARVLIELTGSKDAAPQFAPGTILIVKDLLSYELASLNSNVTGVIMALGSPTSHVSIVLKNMGVASVIAVGEDVLDIPPGSNIILNSELGLVTVNPVNIEEIKKQKEEKDALRALNIKHAKEPAVTTDGEHITVKGNVGSLQGALDSFEMGGEGLGLVRTEFLYSNSQEAPCEEEQFKLYQQITDTQKGNPVIFRTLDAGGDKPVSFLPIPEEENPIMGIRGVRSYGLNMDLFKNQVRAIMRVAPHGKAQIMLPMIGFVDEFLEYKRVILEEKEKLGIKELSVGIMVEVPSAALLSAEFARHADFFSIGTNDLTQYALAIDRGHAQLSPLADTMNPAVLKLIEMTVSGAAKYNKPVGVCGAIASDICAVPILLGLGIREISVVNCLLADIKAFIRTLDLKECRTLASLALGMQEARQVREMVKTKYNL